MLNRIIVTIVFILVGFSEAAEKQQVEPEEYVSCYSGDGHGGSLELVKFQKNAANIYSVLYVSLNTGSMRNRIKPRSTWPGDAYQLVTKKALIDSHVYEEIKEKCVIGLNNAQEGGDKFGLMSTHDFLSGLKLGGGEDNRMKIYCGYRNSAKESFYRPLQIAFEEISKLSADFKWEEADGPEFADLISDTLILLYPYFQDSSWWWPKDRLIRMSGVKGNTRAIPILVKVMQQTRDGAYSDSAHVNERNLGYIVTALDEITEQSLRFDEHGDPRPLDDVVNEFIDKHTQKELIHDKSMDSDKK